MRQFRLILGFLVFLNYQALSQGVINGNFESWNNKIYFEDPALMTTPNIEMMWYGQAPLTLKSTDAASGNYSVHLKSAKLGNDTSFGYFLYGNAGDNLTGGVPYSDRPDSVRMKIKYHTPGTADIVVVIIFKKNGLPLTNQYFSIMGKQTNWTDTIFKIDPLSVQPDSVIFGVAACNPFTKQYHPDNWIMVDDIFLYGVNQQLPNSDFESWNTFQNEEPLGWNNLNLYYIINGLQPNVTKSNDAYSGNHAISVKTAKFSVAGFNFDTIGIATTGNISMKGYSGGFPMKAKPDSMTFYYKYNNSSLVTDMAVVYAEFKKFNSAKNKSEVIDSAFALLPGSYQWKKITVKFNASSPVPDTCNMVLASSSLIFGPGGVGNQLLVDDILFYYNGLGVPFENLINTKYSVFPNPASTDIYLLCNSESDDLKISILNISGQRVKSAKLSPKQAENNIHKIDVNSLQKGTYFIKIEGTDETQTLRFIKQ